ncbi:unnamed protein product [Trifolium pratense]|uniref:Uncharacterized protein n=1 Tax=Trifolium pratense TaxID=57577 RepID=A0ACB0LJL9_TRIPR|nr:unnamed protein product [Trifolium pratense]
MSPEKLKSKIPSSSLSRRSPILQLHIEIVDFCEFLSPTLEEKAKRDAAREYVFGVIKHICLIIRSDAGSRRWNLRLLRV